MAMVLLDAGPVQKWLDEHHDGDKLIAFTRVVNPTVSDISGTTVGSGGSLANAAATMQLVGLDPEKSSLLLGTRAGLFAVTAAHFYVLRLGGLKEKIKETAFDAPRAEMRFTAHDLENNKLDWRHWVVEGFPDGKYLFEAQALGKAGEPSKNAEGSDAFLAALGGQVRHLTGDVTSA